LEAGSYNSAPGALTQGSALQVEHIREKNMVKAQIQAAFRDWDPKTGKSLKKHLKEKLHHLPEMTDDYIDHFIDLTGYYQLKKSLDDSKMIVPRDVIGPSEYKKKEYVFCKAANEFFGLGKYVPIASQNLVLDGQIDHDIFPMNSVFSDHLNGAVRESLNKLVENGDLDKVLLMDMVMGLNRLPTDLLVGHNEPNLALVQNEDWGQAPTPTRWELFGIIENQPLHPHAILWLQALDAKKLLKLLRECEVDNATAKNIAARLTFLQDALNGRRMWQCWSLF